MEQYYQQFSNWLTLRNYAARTKKSYLCSLRQFWTYCEKQQQNPTFSKANAVEHYLLYRYQEQKVSWQTVNGDYSSLRLFYTNILDREWDLRKLPRPRKQKSLPKVITPEQVSLLIENGVMFKHKVFFTLIYSTGLRLGEALRLRVEDVDVAAMQLRVLDGKGKKDRFTLLSPDTLDLLRFYIRAYRPKGGLIFNGKFKGKPWSEKGAQHATVLARRKAKLPEFVTAHTLRHSVAISEHRILELSEQKVKIQDKDYAEEGTDGLPKKKELELEYLVFIKKFVKHILPSGFQKIRYYGIWAASNRKTKLAKCQALLEHVPVLLTMKAIKAIVKQKLGIDPTVCSYCSSPNLVTEILEVTSISGHTIYSQNGNLMPNRAPPKLPRHGLKQWMEVRA